MQIILNGAPMPLTPGATYLDAVAARFPDDPKSVLAVLMNEHVVPLYAPAEDGADVTALTCAFEEGRRIYERSLRFLLLLAARDVAPDMRLRIENSTRSGVFADVKNAVADADLAARIEARMRELVEMDLPYHKEMTSRAKAMEYFAGIGETDKVRLLAYRPYEHFMLYQCDGMYEYFYGEMAPSTGYTPVFAVRHERHGLELLLPDPDHPDRPAPQTDMPMLEQAFDKTARWAEILGCQNVADLNEMIAKRRLREFIRVNEALHEKAISDLADQIIAKKSRLVLIAGPSSSGKTTFAHRLMIQLRVLGLRPVKISLDDYYRDRCELPLEADGKPDLERVDALDLPLFNEHIVRLLKGETACMPLFDFETQKRAPKTHLFQVEPGQPIVIEGIHALNDQLTALVPRSQKFMIYISALTTLNLDDHNRIRATELRLMRRIVRDERYRGTPAEDTLAMWDKVRNGERRYIQPFAEAADVFFNSTLLYEPVILKKYAYAPLFQVPDSSPYRIRASRLLKFLNYIQAADVEDEIPQNSILREFIGGSCFYREED